MKLIFLHIYVILFALWRLVIGAIVFGGLFWALSQIK